MLIVSSNNIFGFLNTIGREGNSFFVGRIE